MKNFPQLLFFLFALCAAFPALAQDLPPNPEPGKCYVRCVTPDEWETQERRVMVRPAHKNLSVVPAQYKTVEERIMVKPEGKRYVYVPAEYKAVTETINVEDTYNAVSIVPARFASASEEIEVRPAYANFEYKRAFENCKSDDPRDCMVLCYVDHPAETMVIPTQTLASDASTTSAQRGGKTITITKQELVSPAKVVEEVIPAEYQTITKRVLVEDETVASVDVPAEYRTETIRLLKKKGGITVWEEVDCELTSYNVIPIFYELGSARLTSASRKVVDEKLYNLMKAKPLIRIEINSHTDARGSSASNQSLSQRRAESVVNYLVSRGISRSRLEANGYGEERLVNRCDDGVSCSESEHAKNRRTEFRVLGI